MSTEYSRRDDLESIGYILISFLRAKSQIFKKTNITGAYPDKLFEKRIGYPIEEVCENLPSEFITYMRYVTSLSFEEEPDYDFLKRIFMGLYMSSKIGDNKLALEWLVDDEMEMQAFDSEKSNIKYCKQLGPVPDDIHSMAQSRVTKADISERKVIISEAVQGDLSESRPKFSINASNHPPELSDEDD